MINVLNIISDTNIGGAGRAVLNYLKFMDRENFGASVVMPVGSCLREPVEALGVKAVEIDAMADKSFDKDALGKLKRIIGTEDPDIVHTHGSLSGRIAGKRCGKKVVFTRHSAFPFPSYVRKTPLRLVYKYLYEHYSDRIIAISPAGAKLMTDAGISEEKISVMMNGVSPVERASSERIRELKAQYGIGNGDFVIGILARIEEYKGHIYVLEALRLLRDQGRKVKLIIAGTGGFEGQVREHASELGVDRDTVFTGFVSDVSGVLSLMDLQVNASYISETSSLSLLEGMSMGLPMAASDCCGNPWIVDDGISGFLFPPKDAAALADIIDRVVSDRDLLKRLGEGALAAYKERFTGQIYAKELENIYRGLLAPGGKE